MTWTTVTVGDVCLATTQADPARLGRPTFRYVDISGVDRDAKAITKSDELPAEDAPSRARKLIETSDILVSTVRPNLNAVAFVPPELDGEIASTGFSVLRANEKLASAKFLYYWTQHPSFVDFLVANATGASYPAVSDAIVKRAQLPLPPLSEQHRIVELLDEADRLRRLRRAADAKAARILPALFLKMFGDPATNPMGWPVKPLGEVANVNWGNTSITKASYTDTGFTAFSASGADGSLPFFEHEEEGIVVSAIGARCGRCFLASGRWTAIKNTITVVQPTAETRLRYLMQILDSEQTWPRRGGGQPFIALGDARSLLIPVPPEELQHRFQLFSENLQTAFRSVDQPAVGIEAIFGLMLQRAFSGQLTA